MRALAQRLRTLRVHRGLSQEQLGQQAGVPRQIISGLENGKRPSPSPATLQALADVLGVTPRQLKGCDPIPELATADPELASEGAAPPNPDAPPDASPSPDIAIGFTSLLRLPPGTVVELEYRPDGSVALTLRIPNHQRPVT